MMEFTDPGIDVTGITKSRRDDGGAAMRRLVRSNGLLFAGGLVLLAIAIVVGILGWSGVLGPRAGPTPSVQRLGPAGPFSE